MWKVFTLLIAIFYFIFNGKYLCVCLPRLLLFPEEHLCLICLILFSYFLRSNLNFIFIIDECFDLKYFVCCFIISFFLEKFYFCFQLYRQIQLAFFQRVLIYFEKLAFKLLSYFFDHEYLLRFEIKLYIYFHRFLLD